MRPRKETIQKVQEIRIKNAGNQAKYLQELLAARLPKYNAEKNIQKVSQKLINAKRLYFDSPQKQQAGSPIKLKKTLEVNDNYSKIKSPNRNRLSNSKSQQINKKQKILNQTGNFNPHGEQKYHPYSILKKLENEEARKQQNQRVFYKYRVLKNIKQCSDEEIDEFIDNFVNKSHFMNENQHFSVTDQFILAKYIDIKISKIFNKPKTQNKQKAKPVQNWRKKEEQNEQQQNIRKNLKQIQVLWNLYELKLQFCHQIMKGNDKDTRVYNEMKKIHRQVGKIQDLVRIQKQQNKLNHSKTHRQSKINFSHNQTTSRQNPNKLSKQVLNKKLNTIIRNMKQIITAK